ncbi:UBC-like protein [Pseudovirgaria hyperparasitica]|uniref:UBC-like protein n=1 Tax=Pseudovirgaria hyperparasitica TaxID=470096 RepID=A0A6A6W935_9PEZI|nr:UBC-like protein [Pseudovirgaria hyperparasitica]KAF2759173.1 UBC-like protein [Pseudovirgaria hyperparasitica]
MSRNPTIKRILKEAAELANNASADFHAVPMDDNLFDWHFTLRGPPDPSPYAEGIYHGRIVLPSAYPHRPPSFRFLTPSGRFEINREICLSISGFHEESWQPAWGIRTALVAIRSFMDTVSAGQVGGLECDASTRKRMAEDSRSWKCPACGHTNEEIMKEREKLAGPTGDQAKKDDDVVPEELRLAYREDLGADAKKTESKGKEKVTEPEAPAPAAVPADSSIPPTQSTVESAPPSRMETTRSPPSLQARPIQVPPTQTTHATTQQRQAAQATPQNANRAVPAWVDPAIYALIAILAYLILKKMG